MLGGVLAVAVAVLVGAVLQSATGFGFALVVGPVLLLVTTPAQSLTTLVLLGLVLNLLLLGTERRVPQVARALLVALLVGALPGEVLGALLLRVAPTAVLQVAVGVLVLVAVGVQLRGRGSAAVAVGPRTARVGSLGVGAVTGVLSTSTGVSGPPMVLWLSRVGLAPAPLRDTLAAAFTGLTVTSLAVLAGTDQLRLPPGGLLLVAGLLVLVVLGQRLGRAVFSRLSPRAFRAASLLVVTAAGLISIVSGLTP